MHGLLSTDSLSSGVTVVSGALEAMSGGPSGCSLPAVNCTQVGCVVRKALCGLYVLMIIQPEETRCSRHVPVFGFQSDQHLIRASTGHGSLGQATGLNLLHVKVTTKVPLVVAGAVGRDQLTRANKRVIKHQWHRMSV